MKKYFLLIQFIALLLSFRGIAQPTTVYTCKNNGVAAYNQTEHSPSYITYLNDLCSTQFGHLGYTFLDNSSNLYNCHSYAWHLNEGNTNKVWINNADANLGACFNNIHNIDAYWTGGCFVQVCNEADADKVHYYCGDHSAVKSVTHPGMWESKWGQLPLVRHTRVDVPYADPTNSVRYYASTKITGDESLFCSGTRNFSVKNIPGATYSWAFSSNLSAVGATNSNQLTVQGTGSGAAWVEVSVSTPCSGSASTSARKNFTVRSFSTDRATTW